MKREVALKEIQERHADDPRSRARFLLEAEVTGSLEHPGIVPVYGLGHHPDGRPYYAMRFIRGGSLKEAVDRHHQAEASRHDPGEATLEIRTLLGKFVDICNAMAYAHSRGVLHRDLKPGNVMLGPYGETLVVDWGLAKSLGRPESEDLGSELSGSIPTESCETVAGSIVGTPAFMSPEQAAGDLERLGPASDVYSLGATLYYVLTGRTPFEGRDVCAILAKVQAGDFPPPRKVRRDVPRPLEAIALKAMATRPEDRYPTARALADDVEHWLAGASVSACPDRFAVKLWRWSRRRPVLTTAAMACLFLDLCYLVISALAYVRSVLHAGLVPGAYVAAGVLVLIPFAGQAGALIGWAAGAIIGGAWRRTLAGLYRGADVGLKVGVPSAIVVYLALGAFGVARPPSWLSIDSTPAPPVLAGDWPRLPGAWEEVPDWLKAGGPVDVVGYFDEPSPEENAASSYLDALLEFDDGMAPCFTPDEGARRGAIAAVRKEHFERIEAAWKANPSAVDRPGLDRLLDDYEVGFVKLGLAQRRPRCAFQTGLGVHARIPHAQAARAVARVAAIRARRRLERGEIDRAIDDVEILLRLARDLRPRGHLITQLVGSFVEATGELEILLPILGEPGLRLDQAVRLQAILDAHGSGGLDPFAEALRAEYVGTGQTIHACVARLVQEERLGGSRARNALRSLLVSVPAVSFDGDPESRVYDDWMEVKIDAQLSRTTPKGFAESSLRAYDDYHRAMLGLVDLPLPGRLAAADGLASRMLEGHPLVLYITNPLGPFLKAIGRAEATRGAMRCLVALRRWELTGRGEPTDLDEVVRDAGMAGIPLDPCRDDGGPLRMAIVGGKPVVYSIGFDGRDDGGLVDAKLGAQPSGDFLYRIDRPGSNH